MSPFSFIFVKKKNFFTLNVDFIFIIVINGKRRAHRLIQKHFFGLRFKACVTTPFFYRLAILGARDRDKIKRAINGLPNPMVDCLIKCERTSSQIRYKSGASIASHLVAADALLLYILCNATIHP
jgi:hypothetical protein